MSDSVVDTVLSELNSPVEEPAPEEPAPEEPAPEEPVEEPAVAEPVTTQEVVQNVQEMLSSTDTSGSVNELENRVKVLEERLEKMIEILTGSWLCIEPYKARVNLGKDLYKLII